MVAADAWAAFVFNSADFGPETKHLATRFSHPGAGEDAQRKRWVLLRHELPHGEWHFDWMMQGLGCSRAGLLSFRVMVRIDQEGVGGFEAQRIGDHREVYLDFEGEVSGGRGRVSRVASGEVVSVREGKDEMDVELDIGRFRGVWVSEDDWLFTRG